jgi:O-antigen biosynthesis protein
MLGGPKFFDEPHHQSLERLAMEALSRGDPAVAFKFADRRCRILPLADPYNHILRAEGAFRKGDRAAAISDISRALLLDPEHVAANRRMLAWGEGASQRRAALVLISNDRNLEVLRQAMAVLRNEGRRAFANVTIYDDVIEGWVAWEAELSLEITVTDRVSNFVTEIKPDPAHPFRNFAKASNFQILRPKSRKPQSILLSVGDQVFYSARVAGNDSTPNRHHTPLRAHSTEVQRVTVIVPVYEDYQATRVCLESLMDAIHDSPHHSVVLVNDATPDDRLAKYLAKFATQQSVELLTNESNIGFVGAVNRALDHVTDGDIILLNSDTVVPLGFINRLAAVARSSSDIGTVTPLSNNGDLAGFPVRNVANPMRSVETVQSIDKIAAEINAAEVVDIPNGIGFCLYITRECLNAIGFLSEDFHRGYLEDVDFCLRARERGFRSVCTPSVYVGHAGSRSFGANKRSLVVRNLEILEQRFPKYRLEYGAFSLLDPLRPYRAAIERQAPTPSTPPRLLVTGMGVVRAVTHARARELLAGAQSVMVLEVRHGSSGPIINIVNASGGIPQSIQFALSSAMERASLFDYIKQLRVSRIEILDPARLSPAVVDLLIDINVPYDIFVADAGLVTHWGEPISLFAVRLAPHRPFKAGTIASTFDREGDCKAEKSWLNMARAAERILVPCEYAKAFATRFLPVLGSWKIEASGGRLHRRIRCARNPTEARMGLLPLRGCAEEQWLMTQVACALRDTRPDISLTVVGATLDDVDLMRIGNTFVTGAIEPEEFELIVKAYDLRCLFVSLTRPIFGHPILIRCFRCPIPLAFFDWSMGRTASKQGDLVLDPRSSLRDIVGALGQWLPST